MSHIALRRIAIRLLHDPELVHALHGNPAQALAGVELSADEIAWLVGVPVATWRTDPERPRRLLHALEDEFPATMRLAPNRAPRFFASPHFHAAIQNRGSLANAFASFMAEDPDPRVMALAVLEGGTAAVRRAPARSNPSPPGYCRIAPHARIVRVRREAPALLAALRRHGPQPRLETAEEDVLILRNPETSEVTIESLSTELHAILRHAEALGPVEDLIAVARSLGAHQTEARGLFHDLVASAILV